MRVGVTWNAGPPSSVSLILIPMGISRLVEEKPQEKHSSQCDTGVSWQGLLQPTKHLWLEDEAKLSP